MLEAPEQEGLISNQKGTLQYVEEGRPVDDCGCLPGCPVHKESEVCRGHIHCGFRRSRVGVKPASKDWGPLHLCICLAEKAVSASCSGSHPSRMICGMAGFFRRRCARGNHLGSPAMQIAGRTGSSIGPGGAEAHQEGNQKRYKYIGEMVLHSIIGPG